MRRILLLACVLFAFATGAVAAYIITEDRADALRVVGERTRSMARMIAAHGDGAVDSAKQIINSVEPVVRGWDLADGDTARLIHSRLLEITKGTNFIASGWVVDSSGASIVDSWTFPARRIDARDRPYFKAHASGAVNPVIVGDEQPGSVTGQERFTVSHAVLNADGSLKAIIVVGIYRSSFNTLYKEAVTWPGARAGLYTLSGGVLARIKNVQFASPAFVEDMRRRVETVPSGTALVQREEEARIVSWNRSLRYPQIFATSSQPVTDALQAWNARAWTTALFALAANLVFWGLAWFILRWAVARQEAEANALAVREVNHRVKNSLQLISSLMQIRARRTEDAAYREAVKELTGQLSALSETYRFVQSADSLEAIDAAVTLQRLCRHLEESYKVEINVEAKPPLLIHADYGTGFAVIVNELVTNAMKHGGGPVNVYLAEDKEHLQLTVISSEGQLPPGFDIDEQKGFGLKAVRSMLQPLGGRMTATNRERGTAFAISIPAAALRKG